MSRLKIRFLTVKLYCAGPHMGSLATRSAKEKGETSVYGLVVILGVIVKSKGR